MPGGTFHDLQESFLLSAGTSWTQSLNIENELEESRQIWTNLNT